MNQADVTKLMSQLRIAVRPNKRHLKNIDGPEGRLLKLRKTVTALVKHERIELFYNRADEARGYAELVRIGFAYLNELLRILILLLPLAHFKCHTSWRPAQGNHGAGGLLAVGEAAGAQAVQGASAAL